MRRWLLVAVALAGCLGNGTSPESGMPAADSPQGDEQADAGEELVTSQPPSTDPVPSGTAATWFLHVVIDCEGEPCNCGLERNYMDHVDSGDDCDGHGNRPFLEPQEGFLLAEVWPSEEPTAAWPAGTQMAGTLYLTTDVQSSYRLFLRLMAGSVQLAETEVGEVTTGNGAFGFFYTPVPFEATLAQAAPADAALRLELHLDFDATATSYFIGYEDDHASSFTLTAP